MRLPDSPPPYASVVFDCDSTLSAVEGVEVLAGPEHRAELERLTAAAMEGTLALEEVYARRLELVRPTRADLEAAGRAYVENLLPRARDLIAGLFALGKRVAIVSGGLRPAVAHLARELGVPADDVHAVDVRFAPDGAYAGFDGDSPLARSGGKIEILRRIATPGSAALVGDGQTDLEAAPLAARFVAFAGVARRESVLAAARVVCESPDLGTLVPLLLSAQEIATLRAAPEHETLLAPHPPSATRP